ncbi:MAG TPA: cupredoxin domain-containing protein [Acidisarcina sp.]
MKRRFNALLMCIVLSSVVMLTGRPTPAQSAPKTIQVTASKFKFTPDPITLKKGEPVILVLTSSDVAHGLRFRDLDIDLKVSKGGTTQVQFTPSRTGDFVGHCSVFCGVGHGEMALTIHVVD